MTRADARWLVDEYYTLQDARIRSAHQRRTHEEASEPHRLVEWVEDSMRRFEGALKSALGEFAKTYRVGQWMQAQCGIGPVISAGLLVNFDIRKAQTVGHFWRFAGLDPTTVWRKGEKRPWNAQLKCICLGRLGESFNKNKGRDACFYGKLLAEKQRLLWGENLNGDFSGRARLDLKEKKYDEKTDAFAWKSGEYHPDDVRLCIDAGESPSKSKRRGEGIAMLPPGQIYFRARRWAVKLFLSHLHAVMYREYYQADPPAPYIFEHPNGVDHRHLIEPPLWPGEYDGKELRELLR
jgi:hypothetical protein